MKVWSVVLFVCAVACCGCMGREKAKPRPANSGVARVEQVKPAPNKQAWKPLVPQTEFEREREIYRDFQSVGGR